MDAKRLDTARSECMAAHPSLGGLACTCDLDAFLANQGWHLPECPRALDDGHRLDGTACSCGQWEAALGTSIWRGFDRHLLAVRSVS